MKPSIKIFQRHFIKQILISIVPIIILGALAFSITYNHIYKTATDTALKTLERTQQFTNQIISAGNTVEHLFNPDAFSTFSVKHMLQKKEHNYNTAVKYPIFSSILNSFVNTSPAIESVYLYWPNDWGKLLVSNKGITYLERMGDTGWFDTYEQFSLDSSKTRSITLRSISEANGKDRFLITIYQKIITLDYPYSKGVAIINIDPSDIQAQLDKACSFSGQRIYLLTDQSEYLAGTGSPQQMEQDLHILHDTIPAFKTQTSQNILHIKQGGYTISLTEDENAPLIFASIIPNSQLYKMPQKLIYITVILILLCFMACLCLSAAYSRKISHNIEDIMDIFHAAQNGQPLPPVSAHIKDEQDYIINHLITTFVRQEYLSVQLSEKKFRARTLELIALQSQINPHFLFNTLETIRMKAFQLTQGSNDVTCLLENLSDIMRYTLSDPNEHVSLEDEISYTKSYLYIQKIRFREKLQVIWEYDPDILSIPVSKLLIQPFLENSIQHGVSPSPKSECFIKIKLYRKNDNVYIHIIDTGIGMTEKELQQIRSHLQEENTSYRHIGLSNTWKRLALFYGDRANICIYSKYLQGTAIVLTFPVRSL